MNICINKTIKDLLENMVHSKKNLNCNDNCTPFKN